MGKLKTEDRDGDYFDIRDIKAYMKVPARLKFKFLEEASAFFNRIKSSQSKKIWNRLEAEGW
jgi:hypothetical protein